MLKNSEYLIFSDAGKLIFTTSVRDSHHLSGVFQALISASKSSQNQLEYFQTNTLLVVIYSNNYLNFVCISRGNASVQMYENELRWLEHTVVSTLSSLQITRIFTQQPNYDLSNLLTGTESLLEGMISSFNSMEILTNCYHKQALCKQSKQIFDLKPPKCCLYYCILSGGRVVSCSPNLAPVDLLLLRNTTNSANNNTRDIENWFPVCLPIHNPTKFVYCYTTKINKIAIMLIANEQNDFYTLSKFCHQLKPRWEQLQFSTPLMPMPQGMRLCIAQYKNRFLIKSSPEQPYTNGPDLERLVLKIRKHDKKQVVRVDADEIICGKQYKDFKIWGVFGPLFQLELVDGMVDEMHGWISRNLQNYL